MSCPRSVTELGIQPSSPESQSLALPTRQHCLPYSSSVEASRHACDSSSISIPSGCLTLSVTSRHLDEADHQANATFQNSTHSSVLLAISDAAGRVVGEKIFRKHAQRLVLHAKRPVFCSSLTRSLHSRTPGVPSN